MTQDQNNDQNRLMNFKDWVPDRFRFLIYIILLIGFQFSNGMYFASMKQMVGELSITMNDVTYMSCGVLIGLTMYFPLAFRLKFRFTNRTSIIIAASGLAICNLILPQLQSLPLLVFTCFIGGFFRLWGTFECFSNILPKITPTYNYAVFLSFVFFVVIGVINIFDILSANITFYYGWKYVHFAAIGVLLFNIFLAFTLMRPFRAMPKMPLYGIDWLGMIVWTIFIMSLIFVAQYGETLGWTDSPKIRIALGISFLALAGNFWRMTNIRHPFIELKAFTARNLWNLLVLFLFMDILLSSQNVLQNTLTGEILGYDYLTEVSLKWFGFAGIAIGAIFSWQALTRLHWSHKKLMFGGMSCIVLYIYMLYYLVSPDLNIEKLYLPLAFAGMGHVIIFISLTVYAQATVPFKNYFQVLCVLGFIRMGIASPIGGAIYSRAMSGFMAKNLAQFGNINIGNSFDYGSAGSQITSLALVATVREILGWSVIAGVIILLLIAVSRFKPNVSLTIISMKKRYKAFADK